MARPIFYPAQLKPRLVRLLQRVLPIFGRWHSRLELIISTEAQVQLANLRDSPCLLLCNHPTFQDPLVMFLFSGVLERPFYYMAAHERFKGLEGWLIRQIGAYSIRRGQADRDSVAYTLQRLADPGCKLVVFPEGGCSFQNDTVMPFRPGAVQFALQALSKQARLNQAKTPLKQQSDAFYIVPVSLKYRYTGQMKPILERTLRRLEAALGIGPEKIDKTQSFYDRLRVVAAAVMQGLEREYGLPPDSANLDWNQRIAAIKAAVLTQCEQRLQITPAPGEPNRERVYRIQRALESRYSLAEDSSNRILNQGVDEWEVMRKALARVLNFDAIYDGYVSERPTPERFLDTLTRLERSVFSIDQPPPKGRRQAFLRVGRPIRAQDYLAAYAQNRTATVQALTHQLQQSVQYNLDILSEAIARDI